MNFDEFLYFLRHLSQKGHLHGVIRTVIYSTKLMACGILCHCHDCTLHYRPHGGGCLPQCMLGYHPPEQTPPRADPPNPKEQSPLQEQTPPPSAADKILEQRTPEQTPPRADSPHPRRDGHCCRRYATYWNAFSL